MLRSRPTAEQLAESAKSKPQKSERKGFMASMMERAEDQRNRRQGTSGKPGTAGRKPGTAGRKPGTPKPGGGSRPNQSKKPRPGGSDGGDPKKRP
jgi:hypothetical protein